MSAHTCSHEILDGLNEVGVEYIFGNFGTDHAPLIEEMARWQREGKTFPKVILCPHENVAMHMAMGYAMATGRGQAVLVHVDAGTANSAMGAHNAMRTRVPLMLIAGRAPFSSHGELLGTRDNYVHFIQEPYDQASIVRPYVKWEYNLPSGTIARQALQRAHSLMSTEPKGPVYLTVSRETLAQTLESGLAPAHATTHVAPTMAGADADFIEALAVRIEEAEHPVLVTSYAGRNPKVPGLMAELADLTGIAVAEFYPLHLNLAHDHPCHGGFMPGPLVSRADLGLLLDVDVPWIPRDVTLNPATHWVQIDVDPVKRDLPLWPFPAHERLQADSARVLEQLIAALKRRNDAALQERAARRIAQGRQALQARQLKAADAARDTGTPGAINPHHLCALLSKQLGADAIVVNEAIRNTGPVLAQMPRTQSGTWLGNGGGGLGFSGGTALGAQLAHPGRTVLQCVGDGSMYFNAPSSVLSTAQAYRLPIFTVVFDNLGWAAVRDATVSVYPQGHALEQDEFQARLPGQTDFAAVAKATGAHGECVADPAELEGAIARCLEATRRGQAAVLHAKVAPF